MALVSWALTTLVKVKALMGITVTTYDTLLESLINQASAFLEQSTSRKLAARAYSYALAVDKFDTWYDGDASKKLLLRQWPLNSVTSPILISGAEIEVAEDTDYYGSTGFISYNLRGELYYSNGFDAGKLNVRVSYNAGYADDSPGRIELELLCNELVALVYEQKDKLSFKSEKIGNYSYSLRDLQEISKSGRMITDPVSILQKYKRQLSG